MFFLPHKSNWAKVSISPSKVWRIRQKSTLWDFRGVSILERELNYVQTWPKRKYVVNTTYIYLGALKWSKKKHKLTNLWTETRKTVYRPSLPTLCHQTQAPSLCSRTTWHLSLSLPISCASHRSSYPHLLLCCRPQSYQTSLI